MTFEEQFTKGDIKAGFKHTLMASELLSRSWHMPALS
jgi:hypothetical protein